MRIWSFLVLSIVLVGCNESASTRAAVEPDNAKLADRREPSSDSKANDDTQRTTDAISSTSADSSPSDLETAIEAFEAAGGKVTLSKKGYRSTELIGGFSPSLAAIERIDQTDGNVVEAQIGWPAVSDDVLQHLAAFTELERLVLDFSLDETEITGSGFKHLATKKLRSFYANKVPIDDQGLSYLKDMTTLEGFSFYSGNITDEGMASFDRLTNLRGLVLSGNAIGDSGVAHLKNLTSLTGLDLSSTKVADQGVSQLTGLNSLRVLNLNSTQVTDASIESIILLTNLHTLSLGDTKVTDAGIERLKSLVNLKSLTVWKTGVTDQGVQTLEKALPELKVNK